MAATAKDVNGLLVEYCTAALNGLLPAAGAGATGPGTAATAQRVTYASDGATVPVSGPLTDTQLRATAVPVDAAGAVLGTVTETAPASDTASSGLNGRLQRIAQRLTTIITSGLSIVLPVLSTATNRSGTATTTSGGLTVAANTSRKSLVGQNLSAVNIGFHEFNGTAVIGTAGTYTVPAGGSFSISTQNAVNFIAASGTAAVTLTET